MPIEHLSDNVKTDHHEFCWSKRLPRIIKNIIENRKNDAYIKLTHQTISSGKTKHIQIIWDSMYQYGYCPDYGGELVYAASRGNLEMFKYILNGFENSPRREYSGEPILVKFLIDIATKENRRYGADIVKFLKGLECEQINSAKGEYEKENTDDC